ncbi:MAG: IS5 family transposase, partial [Psychrobacter sp.]
DGYPLHFKITGGDVHDSQIAGELIEMIGQADYFIADKGYDSECIRDKARSHNMIPVVPKRKNAKQPNPEFDSYLYKLRHLVENMFARLKHFRSIATRYEKLARNFKSMLYLACTIVHCKMN